MTESEKIEVVKVMVGSDCDESLISTYLLLAGKKIIATAYPYDNDITEVPTIYETLQCEIACYLINKRGAEGQISHTENSITRSYESGDIPSSLLKRITPHCGTIK